MYIGIDIRTLMDARYSGVSEYVFNLIKEMLNLDRENEYRFFYNCFGDCPHLPLVAGGKVKIIKYNYPNKVLNYLFFKFFNYPKIDKELGVDVLFMPHINFIGLSPLDKGEERGVAARPSLITVHDLSFLRYPEFFSWRKNFWHKMVNVKKLLNQFSQIVSVSENTKRDIMELCGVEPDKIKVIYSGVGKEYRKMTKSPASTCGDCSSTRGGQIPMNKQISNTNDQTGIISSTPLTPFPPDRTPARQIHSGGVVRAGGKGEFFKGKEYTDERKLTEVKNKYSLPKKFILYLGTIEPRKNVDGIMAAYNELRITSYELRDYKLVIAGGRGWKSRGIYKEWERSEFKNDIKFLGYIDPADKVYLYNLATVFVYPSFYEGFGLPPLEAMACGLPVVSSFTSSLPEVVGDASLMADPYNVNDLARALAEILTDNNLRNKLIGRGLERAKKFTWEKAAREYLKILTSYEEV
ncbi:hypothetical protein A3H09_01010 [Candidatus Falkowbacteria bacterium RIFCSPLOWO2_12_FULL_45_13]|uniref:Glycosyl transferase family 1 domain-containing protein n=1 Tax=Candidatus Falkowbacteria bacterium RIFCSPLOWO2_12_FULL_45_13 TaxID=1797991 RepID=A0A1F5SWB0_9BACT|nr:MAG: hypothetical protein A3H09_01010 [Candidatus Falkowbacteria bacterium RIFCSPLOWO2_12_FULL_45_13]